MQKNRRSEVEEIRLLAESDLITFAKLVNPTYLYGEVHEEVMIWLSRQDARPNQLVLLPRGHLKSHLIAVWCAWWITKRPETTVLYLSATATLAEAQLLAIKNILDSDTYRRYWPEMIYADEAKRARWTTSEIIVDHPKRKIEGVRDATIVAAGLNKTTTGLHADIIISDDIVVPENAYTDEGRRKVAAVMSQMASIKNAGGITKAVGTRYHPRDQYSIWLDQKKKVFEGGEIVGEEPVWEVFERKVESDGIFLWPRDKRTDGREFGFDHNVLSSIEAEYEDRVQFHAQYYNNPNDPESDRISREKFQYYDKKFLEQREGDWYFKDRKLNVYAAIDFAFSLNHRADFTSIVVVGVDCDRNFYVLDIDRFKTDKISIYYEHLFKLYSRWEFRKLRAEVTVAQSVIVRDLRDQYIKPNGLMMSIDEFRPSSRQGSKEERISATLEPKYDNLQMWHFRGGYIADLEDELIMSRPPHDDIKDALASAVDLAIPPAKKSGRVTTSSNVVYHSRFGGVAY